ncbi:N-acetylneuraminate synthase family protein [Amylibacter sp.]|nr:N-acetylneuraminate synthase family protein [Amylibacter sp.]
MSFFKNLVNESDGGIYIIAEACDNHMGSLEMAKALARAAKFAGSDAVKFQHHIAYEEMLREAEMSSNFDEHLYDFLEKNALTIEEHYILKEFCDEIDITYLCTPFSFKAAEEICELVPFFKIGSGEFQDLWFLNKLAEMHKPVILSSGMCDWNEIVENVIELKDLDFALLNCLSEYPPKYEDMNLKTITKLKNKFPNLVIGHSDHTQSNFTSLIAASLGAEIIEKHITLSEFVFGPDKDVSLDIRNFKFLIDELRLVKTTLGAEKKLQDKEKPIRKWAYRSVVAANDLEKGTIILDEHICTKRPGTGIPSSEYKKIIGRRIKHKIHKNTTIKKHDLK